MFGTLGSLSMIFENATAYGGYLSRIDNHLPTDEFALPPVNLLPLDVLLIPAHLTSLSDRLRFLNTPPTEKGDVGSCQRLILDANAKPCHLVYVALGVSSSIRIPGTFPAPR